MVNWEIACEEENNLDLCQPHLLKKDEKMEYLLAKRHVGVINFTI